jgi:predicted transcriptional regulator
MDAETLRELRQKAELSVESMATMLNVTADELQKMEAGEMTIPARFDPEAYHVAENAIPWDDYI